MTSCDELIRTRRLDDYVRRGSEVPDLAKVSHGRVRFFKHLATHLVEASAMWMNGGWTQGIIPWAFESRKTVDLYTTVPHSQRNGMNIQILFLRQKTEKVQEVDVLQAMICSRSKIRVEMASYLRKTCCGIHILAPQFAKEF